MVFPLTSHDCARLPAVPTLPLPSAGCVTGAGGFVACLPVCVIVCACVWVLHVCARVFV